MVGLSLQNVSHAYGRVLAVDDVSIEVGEGELVCLLGPSGCGKSTTLRIAAGLEPLQQGRVVIKDRLVACDSMMLPPERRGVGLVFQDYALFPHLTVLENVGFGIVAPGPERRRIALAMLRRVGLEHYSSAYPHMLSGGEQQRVALARALAPQPALMLMDEPFSGLDIRLRDAVRDETLDLLKASQTATLLVTHDPEEAMRMADRIAVMRQGRIVQLGTPDTLYNRPAEGFIARFFGEVNDLKGTVRGGSVETPWGLMPAPHLPEGCPVEVLIRPEGLEIGGTGATAAASVVQSRSLGPYGLVRLVLEHGQALVARTTAPPPPAGSAVTVRLDPARAYLFQQDDVESSGLPARSLPEDLPPGS